MEEEQLIQNQEPTESYHSHAHHSRAYYSYRRKKHKVKKFFRKRKLPIIFICVIIAVVAVFVAVGNASRTAGNRTKPAENMVTENGIVSVQFPYFSQPHFVSGEYLKDYLSDSNVTPVFELVSAYPKNSRLDIGTPAEFNYHLINLPDDAAIREVSLDLTLDNGTKDTQHYAFSAADDAVAVYNLKTASRYQYQMQVTLNNGTIFHTAGAFDTAMTPRLMNVDGAVNVRDIGGWKTTDGRTIKQGLLYRGSEIDGCLEKKFKVTQSGMDTMRQLGIIFDADLRSENEGIPAESALGKNSTHRIYNLRAYKLLGTHDNNEPMRALFSDLADRKNYPMYLHCTYGIDRTGTACYVLEALLGLSKEHCLREYELSTLYYRDNNARREDSKINAFIREFDALPGNSQQEKAERFLLSIGVTKAEIESIRNILLEK